MATVTIPVGGVDVANTSTRPSFGTGGATITSGQCVYKDTADGNELKATDVTAEASAKCAGILLQDSADGEGAVFLANGSEVKNPSFTEGTLYYADTNGAIVEYSDLASGEWKCQIGYGNKSGNMVVNIVVEGETKT